MEQHFEESTTQFAEDVQQCIIRLQKDISTQSKICNENYSLIQESSILQSLQANIASQSLLNENVANTAIPSHSNEDAMDKHLDGDEKERGTVKGYF